MILKVTSILAAIVAGALVAAQPAKLAWSRTSSFPGVAIDTVAHGIVNSAGNFVIVGANQQDGILPKGNITIFNRKTAAMQTINIVPPGNGPMGLSRIIEDEGLYFVFGTTRPVGANADLIYVGKFDGNLNLITQTTFAANTYSGTESVTDVGINDDNKIFMTGLAQKYNKWQVWTTTYDMEMTQLDFIMKVDVTQPTFPELTLNGIIAILIGFVGDNGPVLRSYQPSGALNYSFGATQTGSFQQLQLENTMISGYAFMGTSWTEEPTPGNFVSKARVYKINASTGMESARFDIPEQAGANQLLFEDILCGTHPNRVVNVFTRRGFTSAEGRSMSFELALLSTWTDSQESSSARQVGRPKYGDLHIILERGTTFASIKGLAINNATKFSVNAPVYNLSGFEGFIEIEGLFHLESGDILSIRSNPERMQVNCVQQAPTAITDSYQAKSGVTYRPPNPVFANDRYALGSGISIVEQPLHGTVTMGSNGFFAYKSTPGYVGPDSFKYRLTKAGLNTSQATVNINVVP